MKLTIPLTGTVLVEGDVFGKGDLKGDDKDSIRPVDIDLGNVSWTMVDIDLENEVMEIEVSPADILSEPDLDASGKQKKDKDGNLLYRSREATEQEKAGFLEYARNLIEGHTKEELYSISKCPKLKKPPK